MEPLDVDVEGDTSPEGAEEGLLEGSRPRCIAGASVMSSSCGGEILCTVRGAVTWALNSEIRGFRGRLARRLEDDSSDSIAKDKNAIVLLLTPKVHRYSDSLVR